MRINGYQIGPGENLAGANLAGSNLRSVDLSGANLVQANLSRANLSGANLSQAQLRRAELSRCEITGANLSHADLSNAEIADVNGSHANFENSVLVGATFEGSLLEFANFSNARVGRRSLTTEEEEQIERWLSWAEREDNYSDASAFPYEQVRDFTSQRTRPTSFRNARMRCAVLIGVDLSAVDIRGADLSASQR
jgi:uncharacterized protein YjbI with pentapeptide repeats